MEAHTITFKSNVVASFVAVANAVSHAMLTVTVSATVADVTTAFWSVIATTAWLISQCFTK